MDEKIPSESPVEETTSSLNSTTKPLAFTIDFSDGKSVDFQRHKTLVEKYKNRHKRGESLSKIESTISKKQQTTHNSPRKSSFQSDGYFSSDEIKTSRGTLKRDLSLPLKHSNSSKMTQSFPNSLLSNITSPEVEIKDISSPELDLISPLSPYQQDSKNSTLSAIKNETCEIIDLENEHFVDGSEFDFDKSDTVSDTGTYTLDADNYSEDQKLRMSIDREFRIESITGLEKSEEYIKSLTNYEKYLGAENNTRTKLSLDVNKAHSNDKLLSPILSPTQNLSITDTKKNEENDHKMIKTEETSDFLDRGSIISVTSSGVFRTNKPKTNETKLCLTKSEVQVETYVDEIGDKMMKIEEKRPQEFSYRKIVTPKLSANVINVQNISIKSKDMIEDDDSDIEISMEMQNVSLRNNTRPTSIKNNEGNIKNNGISTKIPSPIHLKFRPRTCTNFDFSDNIETETYLNSTESCINSLQQRILSAETNDYENKPYEIKLNNAQSILKQTSHIRHNSLDGKNVKISNKLEHFQSKNFNIDQTTYLINNKFGGAQCCKIQNSPNNSPIKRSSSFSTTKKQNIKITNVQKEMCGVDSLVRQKIDRNKFGDTTESSSEEDYEKNSKKKDTILTNTRYNRAFSLRRGRLENEASTTLKCPKTPEIRRKFPNNEHQRALSVERSRLQQPNSPRFNEQSTTPTTIQSRYLSNITSTIKKTTPKNVPKSLNLSASKNQVMSRTDSGRFSMKMSKTSEKNGSKPSSAPAKKAGNSGGGRSNSSLTSREVDFQNWKRRKSYDPLKAAAEGKRREMEKKQQQGGIMTQSYNENQIHECDSSPSHSSSVHRSQSFHGTAAIEQLASSDDDEDMTLSADEGFSPPTPSPCELSPARMSLRNTCRERILH